ncbi:hypothetical protein DINM_006032 [Dirofilaria immitis]|nr:hypothetical protein [Dirofilaria immitis]
MEGQTDDNEVSGHHESKWEAPQFKRIISTKHSIDCHWLWAYFCWSIFTSLASSRYSRISSRASSKHGLWWDCTRAEKHVVAVGDFYAEEPLHCMYKFDHSAALVIEATLNNIDEDGAAGESEHHRFWGSHGTRQFFSSLSFRNSLRLFHYALEFAYLAFDLQHLFLPYRFSSPQRIGYAFYVHLFGTLCWMFAFVFALLTTYKFFTERYSSRKPDQIPIFSSGTHFRSDAEPPLLEKYNVAPSRPSPPIKYVREHTYRVTSA